MTSQDSPFDASRGVVDVRRMTSIGVIAMLAASAICVAIAPTLMPDSYSVIEHSISESAAQGVEGAWLARLGFLLLGFAVLTLAAIAGRRWGTWGRLVHRFYGISMIGAAAFAHMPWEDVPYDQFEDFLHTVAAYGVGFAFTGGVLIVALRRGSGPVRIFDLFSIVAAFVIPMVMFNVTGVAGIVQRALFLIGYLWYRMEAVQLSISDLPVGSRHALPETAEATAHGGGV